MRKIYFCFIIAALMFALCSCGAEGIPEMPENELPEKEAELIQNEEPKEQQKETSKKELYEEMLLNFGAVKTGDGKIRANKTTSLYFKTDGFEDGTNLNENNYFSWAMFYFNREYSLEEREELFTGAGENMGWAYPSEYYEPVLYKYFGVTAENLRKGELYNAEKDFYHIGAGGGLGLVPYIVVNETEENAETVVFHITLDYEEYDTPCDMALTVKLLPDGGYNYISYMPYAAETEKVYYSFKLGPDGEEKKIAVGDRLGAWTLESISGNENDGIEAVFTGAVQADCLIYDDRMTSDEPIYFFEAVNGDEDKFPVFAGDGCLDITFSAKESDIKGEIPDVSNGSKVCFGYVITEYHYNFMPMSVLSFAKEIEVYERFAAIETKEPELIEKHIFALNEVEDDNFGAETKDEYLAMLYKTDPGPGAYDKQPDAIVTREEAKSEEYSGWFENQMIEECREITNFRTEDEIKEYLGEYLAPELFDTDALKIHIIEFGGKAYRVWYSRGYGVKSYGNSKIISRTENEMTAKAFIYHNECEVAGTAELEFEKQGENWVLVSVKDSYYRDES